MLTVAVGEAWKKTFNPDIWAPGSWTFVNRPFRALIYTGQGTQKGIIKTGALKLTALGLVSVVDQRRCNVEDAISARAAVLKIDQPQPDRRRAVRTRVQVTWTMPRRGIWES